MTFSSCGTQIRIHTDTKNHCTKMYKVAKYAQQHPTRLGKQLHPQTVGLLFSAVAKYHNYFIYRQLLQCVGTAV